MSLKYLNGLNFLQTRNLVHYPVMHEEVFQRVKKFAVTPMKMLDCTYGTGAHFEKLKQIPNITLKGMDIDERMCQEDVINDNFVNFHKYGYFDIIFADLGYNITQVYDESYGMSYRDDHPLDMRFSKNQTITAEFLLNKSTQLELQEILHKYGEIGKSHQLSKEIIKSRPITTTKELRECVQKICGSELAQVFQAFRIAVNQEIPNLDKFLKEVQKQQRHSQQLLLVLAFHSLEYDLMRKFININNSIIKSHKIIKPSIKELDENPRSRSARLFECILN